MEYMSPLVKFKFMNLKQLERDEMHFRGTTCKRIISAGRLNLSSISANSAILQKIYTTCPTWVEIVLAIKLLIYLQHD